jgi:RimJ/RimL family protein N-acetyltransferase
MQYLCLKAQRFATQDGYTIVPLRKQDIQKIREWRNTQIDILRQQMPLTTEQQETYYQDFIEPSFRQEQPTIILFSFLKNDLCIGYGGLVHIDWLAQRGEVSFLVNPEFFSDYENLFEQFYALMQFVAFEDLKFHRIFTETFAFRLDHMPLIEQAGFRQEGHLREHVFKRGRWHDSFIHGLLSHESQIKLKIKSWPK